MLSSGPTEARGAYPTLTCPCSSAAARYLTLPPCVPVALRQEIDGPHAEQLEFVLYGQILQDEDNNGREEKLSPAPIRNKETTYSSFLKSRRPS